MQILVIVASTVMILTLFLSIAVIAVSASEPVCEDPLLNSAFIFIKPHANTLATQKLVKEKLQSAGIEILSEHDIDGKTIDNKSLIDHHYYSIASKATILPADKIPVPANRFHDDFGESWQQVLKEKRACNAMEACRRFGCTAEELNDAWREATKVVKFGGGFYCGLVSVKGQSPLYVFNAFFMSMREKFVTHGSSIRCYVVQWDPSKLSWKAFRNTFLGPTDPLEAPRGSLRRDILDQYQELGLEYIPNKGDNSVHASASPFEGLVEKLNWLNMNLRKDSFGIALLDAGITRKTIMAWSLDPQVNLPDGSTSSIFDALEDLDAEECKQKLVQINKFN